MKINFRCLALLAVLALLAWYGAAPLFLPQPGDLSVPAGQFSAERAMAHVAVISQKAHPAGSPEMQSVANYLVDTLRQSGLEAEIQESEARGLRLRNVVARIPGTQSSGTILILAHPDSTVYGPGAGDDATGAAVLLETARALKSVPDLKNDILLLFDDGEELGYLGGYAFAQDPARMTNVRLVIGLDTAAWGPVVLLQTTPNNAGMIRAYAASVPDAVPSGAAAFGFFADADWYISHDTSEIQPFYERGLPGLEFEDPTGFAGKHSPKDSIDRVHPGSLQQMGSQVLALARHLGSADLSQPSALSEESYFSLWGIGLVHYPATWNRGIVWLGLVLLLAALILQVREKRLPLRALIITILLVLLLTLAAGILGLAASRLFSLLFPNPNPHTGSALLSSSLPAWLASLVIISGLYLFGRGWVSRRFGVKSTSAAGLIPWALLAYLTSRLMPVGSYLFALPLLLMGINEFWRNGLEQRLPWAFRCLPIALAVLLFTPNIILAYLGTGLETLILVAIFIAMLLEAGLQIKSEIRLR